MDALINLPFLLFCLGALLAASGRLISMPADASTWLGTLLVVILGLKGGLGIAEVAAPAAMAAAVSAGLLLALLIPLLAYPLLTRLARLPLGEAAAAAGHYGSISVATFVALLGYLSTQGVEPRSYMIAVMGLMEVPALAIALLLARRDPSLQMQATNWRATITNAPILLLAGCMLIGAVVNRNKAALSDTLALISLLPGLLGIYLLLLGQKAGSLLRSRALGLREASFAALFPLLAGAVGIAIGKLFGVDGAELAALAILAASASYIVAPAVLSQSLPTVPITRTQVMVIGITFPVNLLIGIPLWSAVALRT